jgi:hypothetical protein
MSPDFAALCHKSSTYFFSRKGAKVCSSLRSHGTHLHFYSFAWLKQSQQHYASFRLLQRIFYIRCHCMLRFAITGNFFSQRRSGAKVLFVTGKRSFVKPTNMPPLRGYANLIFVLAINMSPLRGFVAQSLNLSTKQPFNLSTKQPFNCSTNQPVNCSTTQLLNHPHPNYQFLITLPTIQPINYPSPLIPNYTKLFN